MGKYAILENDLIINIIEADPSYAEQNGLLEVTGNVGIGWTFENGEFVEPTPEPPPKQTNKEELMLQLQQLQTQIQALE